MRVGIIGQGYVGLTVAAFAADTHQVIGFDKSTALVEQLNLCISHIEGISDSQLRSMIERGRYKATTSGSELDGCEVIVIAVPTPLTKDRKPDLSFLESACDVIAGHVTSPVLIINESTSFPGTLRDVIKGRIEAKSSVKHQYASSPERVDPGRDDWNQLNTPRLYSGLTPEASAKTHDFYSAFCNNLVEVSSPEVAEAAKLFENSFRQVNIAFVNEFAQIAHALGIPVREVLDAADTKPYGFMKFTPSAGVGGHCIPVDPTYLADIAAKHGVNARFIELANDVNLDMAKYVVDRIVNDYGSLSGKSVQIVGVAYKPNVADVRETPAELIREHLLHAGAIVTWHDPLVSTWNGEQSSPLGGSEIAIVVTSHNSVDVNLVAKSAPYVFDTTGKIPEAHKL